MITESVCINCIKYKDCEDRIKTLPDVIIYSCFMFVKCKENERWQDKLIKEIKTK